MQPPRLTSLHTPPPHVVRLGRAAVQQFLRDLAKGFAASHLIKVVLLGDQRAGKHGGGRFFPEQGRGLADFARRGGIDIGIARPAAQSPRLHRRDGERARRKRFHLNPPMASGVRANENDRTAELTPALTIVVCRRGSRSLNLLDFHPVFEIRL